MMGNNVVDNNVIMHDVRLSPDEHKMNSQINMAVATHGRNTKYIIRRFYLP